MEKNDFLLYNEVIYRIHACRTMEDLRPTLLMQLRLLIPYTYASLIPIQEDPETRELIHGHPFSVPMEFAETEAKWTAQTDQWYTLWLSHTPESMVIRERDILTEGRFSKPSYDTVFRAYAIHDCMQMNIAYAGKVMARLALYRTKGEGLFSDQEAFYLRSLANHIGLAYDFCQEGQAPKRSAEQTVAQMAKTYGLTRREEEILGLIFQDLKNEEIARQIGITRNTLHKHLQNIYRKCGVSSRWELMKLDR